MACKKALLFAAVAALSAGEARAQTMYRGYDIGPDFGRMLQEQLRRGEELGQEMRQREAEIIEQTMQDPRCQAMYQQYRARGGPASFPEFAYRYAATGGFSPQGIAQWNQNEAANAARERAAVQRLRQAEQQRGNAQRRQNDRFYQQQEERGRTITGQGTWIDPYTGQRQVLPYLGPNSTYTDPRSGNQYARDQSGRYWVRTPTGQEYPMQPGP